MKQWSPSKEPLSEGGDESDFDEEADDRLYGSQ
jgi:hypothetical protein